MNLLNIKFPEQNYDGSLIKTNFSNREIYDCYRKGCVILGSDIMKKSFTLTSSGLEKVLIKEEDVKNLINHGFLEKNKEWILDPDESFLVEFSEEYIDIYMFIVWLGDNNVEYEHVNIDGDVYFY